MSSIDKLLEVMSALRNQESGCPWDLQQDFASIAPYTIEEAYEVADAIARGDLDDLKDELGDLLFQVVFHAQLAAERGYFDFEAVAAAISEKMTRRHPHVFGTEEQRADGPAPGAWEQIKAAERAGREVAGDESALAGVPLALPALKRAQKLGARAANAGFDWPDTQGVRAKIAEELAELSAAECSGQVADITEEVGDLLFSVVNLARHLDVDPESALGSANRKFERRFRSMEADILSGDQRMTELDMQALEDRWQKAKKKTLSDSG